MGARQGGAFPTALESSLAIPIEAGVGTPCTRGGCYGVQMADTMHGPEAATSGSTNQEGLTSPRERPSGPMQPRLENALRKLGADRSIDEVLSVLDAYPLPEHLPCLRHDCRNDVIWPAAGPPGGFCEDGCRRRYLRERQQLQSQLAELETCLEIPASARKRRRLVRGIAGIRWQLLRYPLVDAAVAQ